MAIAKIARPRRARATVHYLLRSVDHAGRERARVAVIGSTIGKTPEMAIEFLGMVAKLRPRLKRHLYHVSIAVPPGERDLSLREWAEMGRAWCAAMGIENYMIVLHDDHIHIVGSRIRLDGTAASDRYDYRRSEMVLRKLEGQFNLIRTSPSHLVDPSRRVSNRRARSLAELHAISRDSRSDKDYIRAAIDNALTETTDEAGLRSALAKRGVEMTIGQTPDHEAFVLFRYRERQFGQRALGRGYGLNQLAAKGLQTRYPNDERTHQARPPWDIDAVATRVQPERPPNHHKAVSCLKDLGEEALQTIDHFRGSGGAKVPSGDTDRDGPRSDGADEPPNVG